MQQKYVCSLGLYSTGTLQNYADIFLFEVFQRRENLAVVSILYEAGMLTMKMMILLLYFKASQSSSQSRLKTLFGCSKRIK